MQLYRYKSQQHFHIPMCSFEFLSYSPGPFVSLTLSEHDLKHVCIKFFFLKKLHFIITFYFKKGFSHIRTVFLSLFLFLLVISQVTFYSRIGCIRICQKQCYCTLNFENSTNQPKIPISPQRPKVRCLKFTEG